VSRCFCVLVLPAHGEGTYYNKDKSYYIGVWESGVLVQKVKEVGVGGATATPKPGGSAAHSKNLQAHSRGAQQQQQIHSSNGNGAGGGGGGGASVLRSPSAVRMAHPADRERPLLSPSAVGNASRGSPYHGHRQ